MKRAFLIGSVVALVVLSACSGNAAIVQKESGGISQTSTQKSTDSQSATTDQIIVTYTNEGFSPSTIQVKKRSEVVFVNNSTKAFWPASAPHPVHTDYPEFDAKASLGPGKSFSFVFEKVGSWGYHNHLDSSKTGTVNVK